MWLVDFFAWISHICDTDKNRFSTLWASREAQNSNPAAVYYGWPRARHTRRTGQVYQGVFVQADRIDRHAGSNQGRLQVIPRLLQRRSTGSRRRLHCKQSLGRWKCFLLQLILNRMPLSHTFFHFISHFCRSTIRSCCFWWTQTVNSSTIIARTKSEDRLSMRFWLIQPNTMQRNRKLNKVAQMMLMSLLLYELTR